MRKKSELRLIIEALDRGEIEEKVLDLNKIKYTTIISAMQRYEYNNGVKIKGSLNNEERIITLRKCTKKGTDKCETDKL